MCRAEQVLHLADVHAGIEEQGGGGGPQGVRRVDELFGRAFVLVRIGRLQPAGGREPGGYKSKPFSHSTNLKTSSQRTGWMPPATFPASL